MLPVELTNCDKVMLAEIANPTCTRLTVAKTYALALRSSYETDWKTVNRAIIKRWSRSALEYIKQWAHSGKC